MNEKYPNLIKNVIIGRAFQNIDKIKKYVDKNANLIYYPDAEKMKEIILESDIAISAEGQTLHELDRTGVPMIGIYIADNQLERIKKWSKRGFLEYAGFYKKNNIITKINKLLKILKNINIRKSKSKIGRKFIDGKGEKRIARYLLT